MPNILNITLPLKQDAASQAQLRAVADQGVAGSSQSSYSFQYSVALVASITVFGASSIFSAAVAGFFIVFGPELLNLTPLSNLWFQFILGAILTALALSFSALFTWWYGPWNTIQGRISPGGAYEISGIVFAARTLFAFSLGALLGAIIRRSVPAMADELLP